MPDALPTEDLDRSRERRAIRVARDTKLHEAVRHPRRSRVEDRTARLGGAELAEVVDPGSIVVGLDSVVESMLALDHAPGPDREDVQGRWLD